MSKRRSQSPLAETEYREHNGISFRLDGRSQGKAYVATWTCPQCGQVGPKLQDSTMQGAIFRAGGNCNDHKCKDPRPDYPVVPAAPISAT
jgi:hypothetical protein